MATSEYIALPPQIKSILIEVLRKLEDNPVSLPIEGLLQNQVPPPRPGTIYAKELALNEFTERNIEILSPTFEAIRVHIDANNTVLLPLATISKHIRTFKTWILRIQSEPSEATVRDYMMSRLNLISKEYNTLVEKLGNEEFNNPDRWIEYAGSLYAILDDFNLRITDPKNRNLSVKIMAGLVHQYEISRKAQFERMRTAEQDQLERIKHDCDDLVKTIHHQIAETTPLMRPVASIEELQLANVVISEAELRNAFQQYLVSHVEFYNSPERRAQFDKVFLGSFINRAEPKVWAPLLYLPEHHAYIDSDNLTHFFETGLKLLEKKISADIAEAFNGIFGLFREKRLPDFCEPGNLNPYLSAKIGIYNPDISYILARPYLLQPARIYLLEKSVQFKPLFTLLHIDLYQIFKVSCGKHSLHPLYKMFVESLGKAYTAR